MTAVLATESQNNVGFMAVKETVSSMLGGIANVLLSSAFMANVDAKDSMENITGYTGNSNSTTAGIVSVKERVSDVVLIYILFRFVIHSRAIFFFFFTPTSESCGVSLFLLKKKEKKRDSTIE